VTLLACWLAFPLLLALLATGCGLLVRRVCATEIAGPLLPVAGLALMIVVPHSWG
jgi:hypothetical protein